MAQCNGEMRKFKMGTGKTGDIRSDEMGRTVKRKDGKNGEKKELIGKFDIGQARMKMEEHRS